MFFFWLLTGPVQLSRRCGVLLTVGLYLGTLLWPYSTQFWGHATATAFLVIGLWLLAQHTDRAWLGSGFFLGLAVLSEYAVVITLASVLAFLAVRQRWRALAVVGAGGLPVLVVFGFYHCRVRFPGHRP